MTDLSLTLMALGIMTAHLASLAMLWMCKNHLADGSGTFDLKMTEATEFMAELTRIGSDVADLVEAIADGNQLTAAGPVANASIGDTIMSLIASRMMSDEHGSETEQERAVHIEPKAKTPNDISDTPTSSPE